ncbi:MAG: asparagine synthetase B, partial [Clostridia bacterium]|nr:asparagine synthetase B [Clostridia bacterium]
TKAVLRTAANKTLPDAWAHRPKKGFPVPIRQWFMEDKYYNLAKEAFTSDVAAEYFDAPALMKLLDDHKSGTVRNQRKIWTAYTFLTWHKQFME